MSILIKGMEMPKDKPLRIVLNPNGQLFVDHSTWYTEYEAVEIPPHGRLIDADALVKSMHDFSYMWGERMNDEWVGEAPTVIESEGE